MSYCRFSSDDWRSDAYVYESQEGWVVHVAAKRGRVPIPGPDMAALIDGRITSEQAAEQMAVMYAMIESRELVAIDHPLAGAMRTFGDPAECADWLETLSAEGFHVPAHVVPTLREEAAEEDEAITITTGNADEHGLGSLMRVDAWLYQIDDTDEDIRERMRETARDSREAGETRVPTGDEDLDAVLSVVGEVRIVADVWPRDEETRFTILQASLKRPATVIEILAIARDAYLACMHAAGRTNNGGPGTVFDEGHMAFASEAVGRLEAHPAIDRIDVLDVRPTVYCSYTAWWEGCATVLQGSTIVMTPSIGS